MEKRKWLLRAYMSGGHLPLALPGLYTEILLGNVENR